MSALEVTHDAYNQDALIPEPTLSRSTIRDLVNDSPAHAWTNHPRLNPGWEPDDKPAFDFGTAVHRLILEGDPGVKVLPFEARRGNAYKEAEAEARAEGLLPILAKDWRDVEGMWRTLGTFLDRYTPRPFTDGQAEQTIVWNEGDVMCRARIDWLRDDHSFVDDYKTAASANPAVWSRRMFDHGCHIQQAFYLRGIRQVFGTTPEWRFVVQEKTAPYAVTVFSLAPDALELANRQIDWALNVWRQCLESNVWPAYPDRVCWVNLEPWQEMRWLDREAQVAA